MVDANVTVIDSKSILFWFRVSNTIPSRACKEKYINFLKIVKKLKSLRENIKLFVVMGN